MTLNQVIRRIKTICLGHNQVRRFSVGLPQDWFADKTAKYAAACLQYNAGSISTDNHVATVNFSLLLVDMVHVASDTKNNQDDVLSDMLSVMLDIIAQINAGNFEDWALNSDSIISAVVEYDNDMVAGWQVDFGIRIKFEQNICQIPQDVFEYPEEPGTAGQPGSSNTSVFDLEYIAAGGETEILIDALEGKKVLLVIRGGNPLHKVSSSPDSSEYTWDDQIIGLGVPAEAGQRFLILYRNY